MPTTTPIKLLPDAKRFGAHFPADIARAVRSGIIRKTILFTGDNPEPPRPGDVVILRIPTDDGTKQIGEFVIQTADKIRLNRDSIAIAEGSTYRGQIIRDRESLDELALTMGLDDWPGLTAHLAHTYGHDLDLFKGHLLTW